MLEAMGCTTKAVDDGRQALDALATLEVDLVLMDCQMPEMDGFEATRAIRQRETEGKRPRIPIVAITANVLDGDRELCLQAGMDDYLTKPFTQAQLRTVIERWAHKKSVAA